MQKELDEKKFFSQFYISSKLQKWPKMAKIDIFGSEDCWMWNAGMLDVKCWYITSPPSNGHRLGQSFSHWRVIPNKNGQKWPKKFSPTSFIIRVYTRVVAHQMEPDLTLENPLHLVCATRVYTCVVKIVLNSPPPNPKKFCKKLI